MAGHGLALVSRRRFCFCAARPPFRAKLGGDGITARIFPYYVFRRSYARGTRLHGNQFHPGGSRDPRYPQHVAIIMDGNGRWATRRLLPTAGHAKGVQAVRRVVEACGRAGVRYLTLFAFSSENWRRPAEEVSLLMRLFVQALEREVGKLEEQGVRLHVIGDLSAFEPRLQELIFAAQQRTATTTACISPWRPITADAGTSCRPRAPCWRPNPIWPRTRNGSMRRICRATCRCPGRPSRTCSSAPAENNAFPIS